MSSQGPTPTHTMAPGVAHAAFRASPSDASKSWYMVKGDDGYNGLQQDQQDGKRLMFDGVTGAGAVSSLDSATGSTLSGASSSVSRQYASSKQDQELLLDFLKEINSSHPSDGCLPRSHPQAFIAPVADASASSAHLEELSPYTATPLASSSSTQSCVGAPRQQQHMLDDVRLHPPALLFPSQRRREGVPPNTFRMTIVDGQLVPTPNQPTQHTAPLTFVPQQESMATSSTSLSWDPTTPSWPEQHNQHSNYPHNVSHPNQATHMRAQSLPPSTASTSCLPFAPTKRYPYPEVRTLHSAVFRAPHVVPEPSVESWAQDTAIPAPLPPSLGFSMPSRAELSSQGMAGVPMASEVGWEQRAPGEVRRPPHIVPPPLSRSASNVSNSTRRKAPANEAVKGPQPPAFNFCQSSSASVGSSSALSTSCPQSPVSQASNNGDPWMPFRSLVSVADKGQKRLERQKHRSYNCPWYRVGYYRKLEEKYGDVRMYDSEDSDYEEPDQSDKREAYDGVAPPARDFQLVRARMLEIDTAVAVPQVPKYFRDWKKTKRRDILRQQRARRERVAREGNTSGADTPPRPRKQGREYSYSKLGGGHGKSSSSASKRHNEYRIQQALQHGQAVGRPGPQPIPLNNLTCEQQQALANVVKKTPLKRQSTSLKLSYEYMANGQIKCLRCGKKGFHNEFALRSHLSHCPGTIKIREQRLQIAAGILPADTPIALPVVNDEADLEEMGPPPPMSRQSSMGASPERRIPVARERSNSLQNDLDAAAMVGSGSFDGAPVPVIMPVFEGNPLVPEVVEEGESLIGREISFRNRLLDGWTKVIVRNYRTRRNSHLIQYTDSTTEWVVLTDQNASLELKDEHVPMSAAAFMSSSSSSDIRNVDSESFESSSRSGEKRGRAYSSADESVDGDSRSSKRRSTRLSEPSPPLLSAVSSSNDSRHRNAFFTQQDELISRCGKGSRGYLSDNQNEQELGQEVDEYDSKLPAYQLDSCSSLTTDHQDFHPHHRMVQQHSMSSSPPRVHKTISRFTGMAINNTQATVATGVRTVPAHYQTVFACRRCHKSFGNKQLLGWHTRKGCPGNGSPMLCD